ncbi:hypothetical protein MLD38_037528 [Melastoma candidum]|uniref:Uncharacterized protein n=1 Tax=Melastoma candidum TaxID=119954 RepID=A0ACB9LMK7_9MYRT|nr:hypothetical protein MLD38_037528 [Melastoma candidum]
MMMMNMKTKMGESVASRILPNFIFIFTLATIASVHRSQDDTSYYDLCAPFACGGIDFSFPFFLLQQARSALPCGIPGYQITCDSSDTPYLLLGTSLYQVKSLSLVGRVITLVNTELFNDLSDSKCEYLQKSIVFPPLYPASGVGYNLSRRGSTGQLSFYFCNLGRNGDLPISLVINYTCSLDCCGRRIVYLDGNTTLTSTPDQMVECKNVTVPGSDNMDLTDSLLQFNGTYQRRMWLLDKLRNEGFSLTWPPIPECDKCHQENGRCGYIETVQCFDQVGVASGSSLLALFTASLLFRKKWFLVDRGNTKYDGPEAEELIRTCQSTLVMNYSFEDIKMMTIDFKHKLGEGGYGRVYKGRLEDGRLVAVKMLDNLNNESEDFVNEVRTIGRIHHLNIIRLSGFCYEGTKRALVYEYMQNGSLGDYLGERACVSLRMDKLWGIAIGIARGIEYLHTGCESRILHLDIKPQNVLLDEDFNAKISDFGLAKIHSRQKSIISMSGARGTVGFIAPELFLRNFGNPSHKSDVYSFGMLLVEMVGMRTRKVKTGVSLSESHFLSWIYDELTQGRKHEEIGNSLEGRTRQLIMIALWCIQMNPRDRPSMTEVLEMLSGRADHIPIPPKPVLLVPPQQESVLEVESASTDEEALIPLGGIGAPETRGYKSEVAPRRPLIQFPGMETVHGRIRRSFTATY